MKDTQAGQDLEYQEDSVAITVPAQAGLEYKFHLVKGDTMRYAWASTDDELFFDFHGQPESDTRGYFESYTVSTADNVRGSLTALNHSYHDFLFSDFLI